MLHEISPDIFNNTYNHTAVLKTDDYVLCFHEQKILLKKNGDDYNIPIHSDITVSKSLDKIYLFALNACNCFFIEEKVDITEGLVYEEISVLRNISNNAATFIGMVGYQIMQWYTSNKYCGKCGTKTIYKKDERAITCPECKNTIYPKISPAIIVAITSKDKILLAHNSLFREKFFSLVAGYLDVGESLEEAVAREVKEEVGINIRNVRYYKSQPWPFSSSVMIGFFAEADDNQPIMIDNKEIVEAAWFTRDNLPNHPTQQSIAGEMIDLFISGKYKTL